MGQRKFWVIVAVVLATAMSVSGCFTTVMRTDTLVSYEVIEAPVAPPPVPADAVVVAPSPAPPGATWMAPYWQWSNGQYTWMVGRWIPTLVGYRYLAAHWVPRGRGWGMEGGGWADDDGRIVATPPATATVGTHQCDPSSVVVASPAPSLPTHAEASPPRRTRIDHTVTLGHQYYGDPRTGSRDDDAPATSGDERVSSGWVTGSGARTTAPVIIAPPVVYHTRPAPSYASPSYGSSYASSAPSYGSSSSSSSTSMGSRTGYGSGQTSSSGGGASYGGRGTFGSGGGGGYSGSSRTSTSSSSGGTTMRP